MKKAERYLSHILLPVILYLYPLLQCNVGVDITDTGYSLGSYFSTSQMGETWVIFATYLSNALGTFFAGLPYGHTMQGMNIYTGMLVSITALVAYYFLIKKIPYGIVFVGEAMALSLCWCPTVILYNYLTYFLFTILVICLYLGIIREKNAMLVVAGVVLAFSVMSRFPNITQAALILAVWYYGWLKKEKLQKVLVQTACCIGGFAVGMAALIGAIAVKYGAGAYFTMISSLFSGGDSAVEGHSLGDMVWSIIDAYLVAGKWFAYILFVVVCGIILWMIANRIQTKGWLMRAVQGFYVAVILVLFRFFYGRGMFNFKYYAYESMFQWVAIFLIMSLLFMVGCICDRKAAEIEKLLSVMLILLILVTPLGSDNYLYPNMNNLFLVAPFVLYLIGKWIKTAVPFRVGKLQIPVFPIQAMLVMVLLMTFIQSVGFGYAFVFRDSIQGEPRDTRITKNKVLEGMYTNREMAEALEEITEYSVSNALQGKKVVLYGNIPAMSCFLEMPSALSTSWADLESYTLETMKKDMHAVKQQIEKNDAPVIILNHDMEEWLNGAENEQYDIDEKALLIKDFMETMNYKVSFSNSKFTLLEIDA